MAYQLNNSTSKQQFSFSKKPRFNQAVSRQNGGQGSTPLCYDVKAKKEKKGGVIGKAPREDWTRSSVVSPSSKYRIKGCFDQNIEKGKGVSMGAGREDITHSNYGYITLNQNPGPGSYQDDKLNLSHSTSGFTIGSKTRPPCGVIFLNDHIEDTPGPGRYKVDKHDNKGGRITTCSERFKQNSCVTPGPGQYNVQRAEKSLNRSLDRSQVSQHSSFSKESRTTFMDQATKKSCTPGPGRYKAFSEFTVKKTILNIRE